MEILRGKKKLPLQIKFNSSLCNTAGNSCSSLLLLVWTSWPGWGPGAHGMWELLRSTGSLAAPMSHGQLSMHGLHGTAACKTTTLQLLRDSRMGTPGDRAIANVPTQLFPFQPKRIPFLQHLIEISPITLFFPKFEHLSYSKYFGG